MEFSPNPDPLKLPERYRLAVTGGDIAPVCALAAAPAVAAPVMALAAPADHIAEFESALTSTSTSARIGRLHGLYRRLMRQIEETEEELDRCAASFEAPERPRWRGGPFGPPVPTYPERGPDGKWKVFLRTDEKSLGQLERMANLDPDKVPRKGKRHPVDVALARQSRARTQKGAQEALRLVRDYRAEVKRREDAAGITQADQRLHALHRQLDRAAAAIRSLPAQSFSDLAIQFDVSIYERRAWPLLIDRLHDLAGIEAVHDFLPLAGRRASA